MIKINEDGIERAALDWLEYLGSEIAYGPDIAFDGEASERDADADCTEMDISGVEKILERVA